MMFLSSIQNLLTEWEELRYFLFSFSFAICWTANWTLVPVMLILHFIFTQCPDSSTSCWWEEKGCWRCWQRQKVCNWCINCAHYEEPQSYGSSTASRGMCRAAQPHVQGTNIVSPLLKSFIQYLSPCMLACLRFLVFFWVRWLCSCCCSRHIFVIQLQSSAHGILVAWCCIWSWQCHFGLKLLFLPY